MRLAGVVVTQSFLVGWLPLAGFLLSKSIVQSKHETCTVVGIFTHTYMYFI